MDNFTKDDGPRLQASGVSMTKKPNPVYMLRQEREFTVDTNEGTLMGKAGDFVAYDPISGHVWPVSAEYVAQHYLPTSAKKG